VKERACTACWWSLVVTGGHWWSLVGMVTVSHRASECRPEPPGRHPGSILRMHARVGWVVRANDIAKSGK